MLRGATSIVLDSGGSALVSIRGLSLMSRTQALIFDFDGVLADTEALHCTALQTTMGEAGLAFSRADYYQRYLGLTDRDCVVTIHQRAGIAVSGSQVDALVARKREHFAALLDGAGLYAGVADTLRQLAARFPLAVASGAFRNEIQHVLQRAAVWGLFSAVIGVEDAAAGKPAPDPFLAALRAINTCKRLHLTPADCLVIEDSPRGIIAAHAAGMRCVAISTSHEHGALAEADAIINDLTELRPEDLP